jgi:hypothetical protein
VVQNDLESLITSNYSKHLSIPNILKAKVKLIVTFIDWMYDRQE